MVLASEQSTSADRRYAWCVVAMLWMVCFFNYADRQAIFSLFPLLHTGLGLTPFQLGIVGSSFMWMYAISGPIAGWFSDRISPRTVVLSALAFWSVVTAGTALSHSYATLIAFRTLGGLGEAFYFPAAMALIGSYHGAETRSRAMAFHQTSVYAGTITGGAMAGIIGERSGWRASFVIFGVLGVVLALVLIYFLRPIKQSASLSSSNAARDFFRSARSVLRSGSVIVMVAVFIGANFVAIVFLTWLPTFLLVKFHMSLGSAGVNSTVYLQIASVIGVLLGGFLADRFAKATPGGRQMIQAIGLLCGVPFIFLTGWSLTLVGLIIGMIGFGFFKGMYDANIWASLYDVIPVEQRGTAAGLMNSLGWLGGGFAPIVIATAAQHFGLGACLSATSAIYLLLALILFGLALHLRKSGSCATLSVI